MKITKHKADGGGWDIRIGGQATGITITKGDAPRYREPQMWDVCKGDDFLFEAKSVGGALLILMEIKAAIYKAEAEKAAR